MEQPFKGASLRSGEIFPLGSDQVKTCMAILGDYIMEDPVWEAWDLLEGLNELRTVEVREILRKEALEPGSR